MENSEILKYIDHTNLSPIATKRDLIKLSNEAIKYKMASVCVQPAFVKMLKNEYPDLNISTVIAFPLGYNTKETKVFEAKKALEDGASEVDMVINNCYLKDKQYKKIEDEINAVKKIFDKKIVKVIIETSYLNKNEKIEISKIVSSSAADFIKTSTGFSSAGANFEDIILIKKHIASHVQIKASAGIKTREELVKYIDLSCTRIGTSSIINILGLN